MKKIQVLVSVIAVLILGVWWYMQQRITFSVVIPVYNAEKYLARCLDSVFIQDGDFEVIAVNDGSTDKSLEILQEYAKKHSNIEVINQKNKGVSAARNAGLKAAKNQYVTFMDADDWLEPEAFKKATKILKKDDSDVLFTGYYDVYDKEWVKNVKGEKFAEYALTEQRYLNRELDKLTLFSPFYGKDAYSDLFYASGGVRARFFRKAFIDKYQITFPEKISCYEDAVFLFRAFLNNPLISVSAEPYHNYYNRIDSISKSENVLQNGMQSLAYMQNTAEFKQANRRTQILINDTWLFLVTLAFANIQRHNSSYQIWLEETLKAYNYMLKFNAEELKGCRNFIKLKDLLQKSGVNLPL